MVLDLAENDKFRSRIMKLFVKLQRVRFKIFSNWKFSVKSQQYEFLSLVALFQARLLDFIENLYKK